MTDILQIYSQYAPHDNSFICGTSEALSLLRDTLNKALNEENNSYMDTFTSDGEGYSVKIIKLKEEQFDQVILPYTDEIYWDRSKKHPCFLK